MDDDRAGPAPVTTFRLSPEAREMLRTEAALADRSLNYMLNVLVTEAVAIRRAERGESEQR
jgi:uncharacterized protein (DUF1778 family)